MKVAFITSGFLPVPASKGGAVENIIVNLINENEKNDKVDFYIFSVYESLAVEISQKYKKTKFLYIKVPFIIKLIDKLIFTFVKNVMRKKNSHSYRYIMQRLYYLKKCSKFLKKMAFDKIVLENHPTQYLCLKWKNNYIKYAGRYYYHCHNEFPSSYGCEYIIKNTRRIICVSEYRKKNVAEYLAMGVDRFSILKNAIDSKLITKKASDQQVEDLMVKYGIDKEDKVLLYTGRIVPGKGIKEIIQSLKLVDNKKYKLLILGASINSLSVKTSFEEEVYNCIDSSIKNNIIFTGFIDYNELYKYYSLADIAILPSIIEDSAPLSVIEALSCGLPIITTNSGGIPEYVNNKCAIVIERNEELVQRIAQSIDMLLKDDDLRNSMSKASLKRAESFNLNSYYNNFLSEIEVIK